MVQVAFLPSLEALLQEVETWTVMGVQIYWWVPICSTGLELSSARNGTGEYIWSSPPSSTA